MIQFLISLSIDACNYKGDTFKVYRGPLGWKPRKVNDTSVSPKASRHRPRKADVPSKSKGSLLENSLLLNEASPLFYSGL